jgi:hypothetical protein
MVLAYEDYAVKDIVFFLLFPRYTFDHLLGTPRHVVIFAVVEFEVIECFIEVSASPAWGGSSSLEARLSFS